MKCPMTQGREDCGSDCEWFVRDIKDSQKGCVIVALNREMCRILAIVANLPDKVKK